MVVRRLGRVLESGCIPLRRPHGRPLAHPCASCALVRRNNAPTLGARPLGTRHKAPGRAPAAGGMHADAYRRPLSGSFPGVGWDAGGAEPRHRTVFKIACRRMTLGLAGTNGTNSAPLEPESALPPLPPMFLVGGKVKPLIFKIACHPCHPCHLFNRRAGIQEVRIVNQGIAPGRWRSPRQTDRKTGGNGGNGGKRSCGSMG